MKKILAIALVALIALSTVFAGGSSEKASVDKLTKIKESGKLVVGTEAQYAPYEFKDADANFVGCDIWLAQQIADELGVKLELKRNDCFKLDKDLPEWKEGNAKFEITGIEFDK